MITPSPFTSRLQSAFGSRLWRLFTPVLTSVLLLVLLAALSFNILSALRAFVNGESLWSKARKEAVAELRRYVQDGDEARYQRFQAHLAIPQGDRAARLAIDRSDGKADARLAEAGFAAGANHPDDIGPMIWLYSYFNRAPHVAQAVYFWEQGDLLIARLTVLGASVHAARQRQALQPTQQAAVADELERLENAFGPIEEGFSSALGRASRLTLQLVSAAISMVALGLLCMTAIFFARLTRQSERSRHELAVSEERLRLGFHATNCGLWDWNILTNEVFYSPWIYDLLEYEERDTALQDRHFIEMVHPADRAATVAAGTAHIVDHAPYDVEFRLRTVRGKYLWVRVRAEAVRDASGHAVRMAGSISDISSLKEAERDAFIAHELAAVTLAAIADAVIRTDLSGRINYCNAVAEALLGLDAAQLCGQPLASVCRVVEDSVAALPVDLVGRVLAGHTQLYENANLYLVRADGSVVAVDASTAAVRDQSGNSFGAVLVLHDVSAERQHAAQLTYQARHDALTGLVNRREFERQLAALLALPTASKCRRALMYVDLDQLKIVNDSGGHAAGDQLIRQLGALLKQNLRAGDLLARLGGDEFGVILNDCGAEQAATVAEALRKLIFETRFAWEGKSYATGLSIGLVTQVEQFGCLSEIMKVADAACFMAKEKGRNRVHCYRTDDHDLSLRHREIEWVARIGEALDCNRFCLYAQRIVPASADASRNQHIELLLRMVDADGGLIAPMSFIPAAERYNLMPKIDRWVVGAAFALLAESFARGADAARVICAINLSGASLADEDFLDFILQRQAQHRIALSSICFEITETAAIANLPKAAEFIASLRALGCRFSLDDFGAGMASFGYLKHLPVDYLKIDGSFVKDMLDDPIDHAMVEAINQIGHVMGKKTIAEFVENDAVFARLKSIGVDYAQGFGVGKPEPFHALLLVEAIPQSTRVQRGGGVMHAH